jgi:hypothetical protein
MHFPKLTKLWPITNEELMKFIARLATMASNMDPSSPVAMLRAVSGQMGSLLMLLLLVARGARTKVPIVMMSVPEDRQ